MDKTFFMRNQKRFLEKLPMDSIAVLFAGTAPIKRGDEKYPFSPDRNFYYVTGIEEENAIALFLKKQGLETVALFIQRDNGLMAKWVGANITAEEAKRVSGIEAIQYIDEFTESFSQAMFKNKVKTIYLDLEKREWDTTPSPAMAFASQVQRRYPFAQLCSSYEIFADLREIKSEEEIALIRQAINITRLGIEEMMRQARPGMAEYEMEAYFDFVLKKHGVRHFAFQTIAASGKNGTILHYVKNNGIAKDGDCILFDVGAQAGWYNGDLSRTFPVNGKFTEWQKAIYTIVLTGQQKVIEAIKPGVPFSSLNELLKDTYYTALKGIGLIQTREEIANYYYHSVSHGLGAETHDIGSLQGKELKAGMVITVEPGLYIAEPPSTGPWAGKAEPIGIRIEDDILVTENGCEVLSKDMIKTIEEIEAFMAEGK